MSTTTGKAKSNGSSGQAVISTLDAHPQASAAELAAAVGLGRSTVSALLAKLERRGEVRREAGGRDGARRLADRWTRAAERPQRAACGQDVAGKPQRARVASGKHGGQGAAVRGGAVDRLPALALDGLVLDYMRAQRDGPLGPGMIAKAIGKSSGATANCLVRLARDQKVRQVGEHPIRYSLARRA